MRGMPRHGWRGHGHGFQLDKRQVAMGQRQRPGDNPDDRPRRTEAQGTHRCDAAHGGRPALASRSGGSGSLCVGDWPPEGALKLAMALSWRGAAVPFVLGHLALSGLAPIYENFPQLSI